MHSVNKLIESKIITSACITYGKNVSHSILEEIICGAGTNHFGTPEFWITDIQVRQEMEARTGKNDPDWEKHALQMLKQHHVYFSWKMLYDASLIYEAPHT